MKTKLLKILKKKNSLKAVIREFGYTSIVDDINSIIIMR